MNTALVVPHGQDHALVIGPAAALEEAGEARGTLPAHLVAPLVAALGALPDVAIDAGVTTGRLVKLTRESAAELARHSGQQGLGVLRAPDGRFDHVLRLDPQGAAQAAAVTNLVSALAMQAQLAHISHQLDALAEEVGALRRGSQIAEEAAVAASLMVLNRVRARVGTRHTIDRDDWASLSDLENDVYAQYFRAQGHLREVERRIGGGRTLAARLRALTSVLQRDDLEFWLRLHVHAERACAQWADLYLQYEAVAAPEGLHDALERLSGEAALRLEVLRRAHVLAEECLALARDDASVWDRLFHPVARRRLAAMERELHAITRSYSEMLGVAARTQVDDAVAQGPSLSQQTMKALGAAGGSAGDVLRTIRDLTEAVLRRGDRELPGDTEE